MHEHTTAVPPLQVLTASLHELVDLFVTVALDEADLGALLPLRLLRHRASPAARARALAIHRRLVATETACSTAA